MKLLITGGAGFIGSAVVRHVIRDTDWSVANVDKLTYAGNLESLAGARRVVRTCGVRTRRRRMVCRQASLSRRRHGRQAA